MPKSSENWRDWPVEAKKTFLEELRERPTPEPFTRDFFEQYSTFTAKQWEATEIADRNKYTLYGGSRGPGKSYWLRWYCIWRLRRWAEDGHDAVRVAMFCENYPKLQDRQISKLAKLPREIGEVKRTQSEGLGFWLTPEWGGGGILLRNLDDPTDYQSAEFAGIAIDELTKNPERMFDELRGSLRWPGIDDTFFVAATNPNGRYFKWVRQYWIEQDLPDNLEPIADEFAYVRALPADNPHLSDDYWEMLDTLGPRLQKAWRDGDWYVAVEGLVYDTFTEDNITDQDPAPGRPFEIAIDEGYIDPRATVFIQRQPDRILVFDELYQTKTLEEDTIHDILERCLWWFERLYPDDWQELVDAGEVKAPEEIAAMTNEALARYLRSIDAPMPELAAVSHEAVALQRRLREADIPARNWLARRAGGKVSTRQEAIKLTRGYILDGQGQRTIRVHGRCQHLIDEITSGYRNKEGPDGFEDEPEDGNDHACNALESWVWLRARR
jgi:hypothetical protein